MTDLPSDTVHLLCEPETTHRTPVHLYTCTLPSKYRAVTVGAIGGGVEKGSLAPPKLQTPIHDELRSRNAS